MLFLSMTQVVKIIVITNKGWFPFTVNRSDGYCSCIQGEYNIFLKVLKNDIVAHNADVIDYF